MDGIIKETIAGSAEGILDNDKVMRNGRWTREMDYGEGSASNAGFPPQPGWFEGNLHFDNIENGLKATGMSDEDVAGIMGENWLRFYDENFGPEGAS